MSDLAPSPPSAQSIFDSSSSNLANKRVLITGAVGFVGRHCLPLLVQSGVQVLGVRSPRAAGAPGAEFDGAIQWLEADLLDDASRARVVREARATHLLHLGWAAAKPGLFWKDAANFDWVRATLGLWNEFHQGGGTRIVCAGTGAEYDWRGGFCSENWTPLRPLTPYSSCKNATRLLGESWSQLTGCSWAWGRVFWLYGPGEYPQRLVASVIRALLQGENAPTSHGGQIRDFLHVHDVANAFVQLLESSHQGPINIASGEPVALKTIVGTLGELLQSEKKIQWNAITAPPDEAPLVVADSRLLRDTVGWSPHYDLRSGLEQTVHWWREVLGN